MPKMVGDIGALISQAIDFAASSFKAVWDIGRWLFRPLDDPILSHEQLGRNVWRALATLSAFAFLAFALLTLVRKPDYDPCAFKQTTESGEPETVGAIGCLSDQLLQVTNDLEKLTEDTELIKVAHRRARQSSAERSERCRDVDSHRD